MSLRDDPPHKRPLTFQHHSFIPFQPITIGIAYRARQSYISRVPKQCNQSLIACLMLKYGDPQGSVYVLTRNNDLPHFLLVVSMAFRISSLNAQQETGIRKLVDEGKLYLSIFRFINLARFSDCLILGNLYCIKPCHLCLIFHVVSVVSPLISLTENQVSY